MGTGPTPLWRTSQFGPEFSAGQEEDPTLRLWLGFMTARVGIALTLLAVLASLIGLGMTIPAWVMAVVVAYGLVCIYGRIASNTRQVPGAAPLRWMNVVAIDLLTYTALHLAQLSGMQLAPLFVVPVLMAGLLGSRTLALAVAAAVVLVLLAEAWGLSFIAGLNAGTRVAQAGVSGIGFFALALLSQQLASRLKKQVETTKLSVLAARTQTEVNQIVIEAMSDGVMVVDANGVVRSINPAAQRMLALGQATRQAPFVLAATAQWQPLASVAANAFEVSEGLGTTIELGTVGNSTQLLVKPRLVATGAQSGASLCILFLEDVLDIEARIRKDRLASMGRMSAAVAHEIRNPLAAITQANSLLAEDLPPGDQQRLCSIVADNAKRLDRIVDDVLSVSLTSGAMTPNLLVLLNANELTLSVCNDWQLQHKASDRVSVHVQPDLTVRFDGGHLRQVLVNLLDNAARYASQKTGAIAVDMGVLSGRVTLSVWSDGPLISQQTQNHLFEPFFSSESRSTGLGLFICKELCDRHGSRIGYTPSVRAGRPGNEFAVVFEVATEASEGKALTGTMQSQLHT